MGKKSRMKKDLSRQADIEVRKANALDRKGNYYKYVSRINGKDILVSELKTYENNRRLQLNSNVSLSNGLFSFLQGLKDNLMLITLNGLDSRSSSNGSEAMNGDGGI